MCMRWMLGAAKIFKNLVLNWFSVALKCTFWADVIPVKGGGGKELQKLAFNCLSKPLDAFKTVLFGPIWLRWSGLEKFVEFGFQLVFNSLNVL